MKGCVIFFFYGKVTTEIYDLYLHDGLSISEDWGAERYALFEVIPVMKEFNSDLLK